MNDTVDKIDYFDVLIPDLVKDVAKQAASGNEHAKQRLEAISRYSTDALEAIKNKPKPFFRERKAPSQKR